MEHNHLVVLHQVVIVSFKGPWGNVEGLYFGGQYGARIQAGPGKTIGPMRLAGASTVSVTGRRARVQNGTGKTFNIQSGGLTAGW